MLPFQSQSTLDLNGKSYIYHRLESLQERGMVRLSELPFSIRTLLESVVRNCDGFQVTEIDVAKLAAWNQQNVKNGIDVPFKPARVILQDFTGVPAVVDLAAMRSAMARLGGDPKKINPLIPVDLIIDHSIQTDYYGSKDSLEKNVDLEFERNAERYSLLHWAQNSLDNFRVIPPSVGIIHQVNLEYLANVAAIGKTVNGSEIVYPDTVLGTDSHTVMINGLGVLGWGVGGIEAEAVMLGQPYYMLAPEVIGFELFGKLRPGVNATDIVLTITEILRREGVVGKFVEFFGPGATNMPVATRAVLANMAPEYGATMGFFPVDAQTIRYLRETGRDSHQIDLVEAYHKANRMFRTEDDPIPNYSKVLSFDLGSVEPSLAGPKRPQDRIPLPEVKESFDKIFPSEANETNGTKTKNANGLDNGSVVIAAITSCTNTSNPELLIAAGLLAKKSVEKGLKSRPFVKTSLAPGSRVVTDYLEKANLLKPLESLGFNLVGYGCMTCIGNSGPLPDEVSEAIAKNDLTVAAVLSGNRNFEGRINPLVKANYLASPPLVVAFAIAGTVRIDFESEPLGKDSRGNDVFLRDIWPDDSEIEAVAGVAISPDIYRKRYENVGNSSEKWNAISSGKSELFEWNRKSTYVQEPPFLLGMGPEPIPVKPVYRARVLAALEDSVTTDHISPAGSIKAASPAGKFLLENGVSIADFNSYGARRGNDRVMTRGTFANIRIRNLIAPGTEGGVTRYLPGGEIMPIYDASLKYQGIGGGPKTPLIVLAGKEYGTGSSRDWAAKGTALLGVRAVIASTFERIHRGNLIGMGVLPLELPADVTWQSLELTGEEEFTLDPIPDDFKPGGELSIRAERQLEAGRFLEIEFKVKVRIDTPSELVYYRNGGILQTVLRKLYAGDAAAK